MIKACIAFIMLASFAFADAAAPMPPQIQLNLIKGGHPFIGDANVTYICSANISETIGLECSYGNCTNGNIYDYKSGDWFLPWDPCFYSNGSFMVSAEGRSAKSQEQYLGRSGQYSFSVDVASGMVNASTGNPSPTPANPICPSAAVIGMCLIWAFMRRK